MKTAVAALYSLFLLSSIHAQDLSFALENNPAQRKRLAHLQGSTTPPALDLTGWRNSAPLALEKLKGKIVVLEFWSTGCDTCIASIPYHNQIFEKYKDRVVFIGICQAYGSGQLNDVIKTHAIKYPVAIDSTGKTTKAYAAKGFPDYYIIDKKGTLVAADCANDKVVQVIDLLLK